MKKTRDILFNGQKSVQWVKISINPVTIDKTDIISYFLEMAPIAFCIEKYHIVSFQYVSFIPVQPVIAIKFGYNIYQYQFCNFKTRYYIF